MRLTLSAAVVLAVAIGLVTPTLAAQTRVSRSQLVSAPTFDDCYRLAWVRGVHVERDELEAFNDECLANQVPFQTGNPADSVRRGSK